jgi:hypothetical protein
VDATVSAPALVRGLFGRLPPGERELVLFDLNRVAGMEPIYRTDPRAGIDALLADPGRAYTVTLLTNADEGSRDLVVRRAGPGETGGTVTAAGLAWPKGVYSLSHVALPFPPDDPLYGGDGAGRSPGVQIGNLVLRGERGVLQIGASGLLRLRWNPFHGYMRQRVLEFTRLAAPAEERARGPQAPAEPD